MKPKIIFTFIDNSGWFHALSRFYKDAQFFAVQNGARTNITFEVYIGGNEKHPLSYMSIPNFFCASQFEVDLYKMYNQDIGNYFPVGWLKLDKFKERVNSFDKQEEYDICLTAIYHNSERYESQLNKAITLSDKYLSRFLAERKDLSFCIALRKSFTDSNMDYYKKIYGEGVRFFYGDEYSSYKAALKSRLVFGVCSTLLLEMFLMGKKVFYSAPYSVWDQFAPFMPQYVDGSYFMDHSVFKEHRYDIFQSKMEKLLSLDQGLYNQNVTELRDYLSPARGVSAQEEILRFIESHI